MSTDGGVSVWFACGSCRQSFQKLQKFMEHKIQKHFTAFQNTKCIIFEERAIDGDRPNQMMARSFSPPAQFSEDEKTNPRLHCPPMIKVESDVHGFIPAPELPHDLLVQRVAPIKIGNQSSSDLIDFKYDEPHQNSMPTNNLATFVEFENSDTHFDVKISSRSLKVEVNNVVMPVLNRIGGNSAQKFPLVLLRRLRHISKVTQNSPPTSSFSKVNNVENMKTKNAAFSISRANDLTQKQKPEDDKPVQIPSSIPTVNSGLRQLKCVHFNCGRIFKDKSGLSSHLHVHSNERPLKCPNANCQKTFKTKNCIHQHLRTHSDARPFKCPQLNCEKSFKDKICLERHRVMHSDLRSFKCSYPDCGKSFKRKWELNCHVKKLHFNTGTLI